MSNFFIELQVFIFPNMVRYNFLLYFCDVAKMAMIYKKIATFGYRQVMWLETCLNPSIL